MKKRIKLQFKQDKRIKIRLIENTFPIFFVHHFSQINIPKAAKTILKTTECQQNQSDSTDWHKLPKDQWKTASIADPVVKTSQIGAN